MNLSKDFEIWDFSHSINNSMTTFPRSWHKPTSIEILGTLETVGRRTSQISIGTHAGTHIDAPSHFIQNGKSIDHLDLKKFLGMGSVIKVNLAISETIGVENQILKQIGSIARNQAIFLNFNWGNNFLNALKYYKDQPWISPELAREIQSLNPPVIGYDLAMLDNPEHGYGCSLDSPIHRIFLSANIPLIENAIFPPSLVGEISYAAIPLSLENLDGSPVRFIGWR